MSYRCGLGRDTRAQTSSAQSALVSNKLIAGLAARRDPRPLDVRVRPRRCRRLAFRALVTVHDWAPSILAHHRDAYRGAAPGHAGPRDHRSTAPERGVATDPAPGGEDLSETVALVPNGLPDDYFRERRHQLPTGSLTARSSTVTTTRKNLRTLLRAFEAVATMCEASVSYWPAGDARRATRSTRGRSSTVLDRQVTFRGPMRPAEVPAYLAGLDVFVHPALEESLRDGDPRSHGGRRARHRR